METTGALQLIVPLIAAVFCAKVVGDALGDGVDDTHAKLRGAPVLDEPGLSARAGAEGGRGGGGAARARRPRRRRPPPPPPLPGMVADRMTVGELAASPVIALPPVPSVARVLDVLAACNHSAFPVTPDADAGPGLGGDGVDRFAAHGVILRDVLLRMLTHRLGWVAAGAPPPAAPDLPRTQAGREALLTLLQQRPVKARRDAALAAAQRALAGCPDSVDLRGFMQRHPFVVPADASLSRAYRLFRTLGLRHLLVAPACPQAVGLVTRKDVCEANARLALGRKARAGLADAPARLVRPGLPFIPYAPYDPTVGAGGRGGVGGARRRAERRAARAVAALGVRGARRRSAAPARRPPVARAGAAAGDGDGAPAGGGRGEGGRGERRRPSREGSGGEGGRAVASSFPALLPPPAAVCDAGRPPAWPPAPGMAAPLPAPALAAAAAVATGASPPARHAARPAGVCGD